MSLSSTYNHLRGLLSNITADLSKAENGNKAASQRVRTGTVRLEKVAKQFRKESIADEKRGGGRSKKPAKAKAKKSASKGKSKGKVAKARPSALSIKRASAKLPARRFGLR